MKIRTLVSNQLYFGLDPLTFRRGAGRALARAKLAAPESQTTLQTLATDFRLATPAAQTLLETFLSKGLLQPDPMSVSGYRFTDRFAEFALARVVPPLPRMRAKELIAQACDLATRINAEWKHNPLVIDMIAVSGKYMTREPRIGQLVLWPVVKRRPEVSAWRAGSSITKAAGATEIGTALRALSSFIVVHVVAERNEIERPFAVPFRDHADEVGVEHSARRAWSWGSLLRG